ncbi:MAG: Cytochrome [Herminiimonas sp.]|nr:Cytochrome [Herminiimonas sp.]MDB5855451.1 Cytochrome [Herminiimonas sp.]
MTSIDAPLAAPVIDVDPFSDDYILNPYPHHALLRDGGPVVRLKHWNVHATGRHEFVRAVLEDPETYCSGAGVGISNFKQEPPWRPPSMVLETDPPEHTRNRAVISRTLSPAALRSLRGRFETEANRLVESLVERGRIEAVKDLAEAFPLKVFADAVGVPETGRDYLIAYGNMVFNGMGPRNALYAKAMANAEEVSNWVWSACQRANLSPDGFGMQIYAAADTGILTDTECATLTRSFLSAGVDTTANAIGNALYCFAKNPEQWQALRKDPNLARAAFEEVMRYESPFQTFFRTTTKETVLGGITIPADEKIMLSLGAANRDPRQWSDPDSFNIGRSTLGHVGFGGGIHGCVGQMIARLELEMVLRALATRVSSIEIDGEPRHQPHNTLRGFETLPVRLLP